MVGNLAEHFAHFVPEADCEPAKLTTEKIAVIGLGYVGLPVAIELAKKYQTVTGFDISKPRVSALARGVDETGEIETAALRTSSLTVTARSEELAGTTFFVVAVPTPIDSANRPDFGPLRKACQTIAPFLGNDAVVVFESTVYPGATEDICAIELEVRSGLVSGEDFHVAYSPERINPGDKIRSVADVAKIVAAANPATTDRVAAVYETIVGAEVFRAASIKVAEAAKVFENTQRDLNIALTNEFARICDRLGIRTRDVLAATGTKWNALPFSPGLVGGHCIGVDPFYLTAKAEELGIFPELMLAGRRTNERVPGDIAMRALRFLADRDLRPSEARVGILGVTFKEDVPDTRNSKVFAIERSLRDHGVRPMVHDPVASEGDLLRNGIRRDEMEAMHRLDLLILAVPHRSYLLGHGSFVQNLLRPRGVLMDIRSALPADSLREDIEYWSL